MRTFIRLGQLLAAMLAVQATPAASQLPSQSATPATAQPAPVEDFAALPFLSNASLSPDGTHIAARIFVAGAERIGIWNLAEPRENPLQIFGLSQSIEE